ncbi:hypothetical protein PR048_001342 [Dryococelus australis]|uniref:Uncharacterized protein n=1 Tax=Dryococelus australis TaxID=614101 RepID=A0ABQ9II33_9NEOP|nr:hypothetical protein PR048_001342 [Dryococelus australis]
MVQSTPTVKYFSVHKKTFSEEFPCILPSRKGEHFAFRSLKVDIVKYVNTNKHADTVQCVESNKKLDVFHYTNR